MVSWIKEIENGFVDMDGNSNNNNTMINDDNDEDKIKITKLSYLIQRILFEKKKVFIQLDVIYNIINRMMIDVIDIVINSRDIESENNNDNERNVNNEKKDKRRNERDEVIITKEIWNAILRKYGPLNIIFHNGIDLFFASSIISPNKRNEENEENENRNSNGDNNNNSNDGNGNNNSNNNDNRNGWFVINEKDGQYYPDKSNWISMDMDADGNSKMNKNKIKDNTLLLLSSSSPSMSAHADAITPIQSNSISQFTKIQYFPKKEWKLARQIMRLESKDGNELEKIIEKRMNDGMESITKKSFDEAINKFNIVISICRLVNGHELLESNEIIQKVMNTDMNNDDNDDNDGNHDGSKGIKDNNNNNNDNDSNEKSTGNDGDKNVNMHNELNSNSNDNNDDNNINNSNNNGSRDGNINNDNNNNDSTINESSISIDETMVNDGNNDNNNSNSNNKNNDSNGDKQSNLLDISIKSKYKIEMNRNSYWNEIKRCPTHPLERHKSKQSQCKCINCVAERSEIRALNRLGGIYALIENNENAIEVLDLSLTLGREYGGKITISYLNGLDDDIFETSKVLSNLFTCSLLSKSYLSKRYCVQQVRSLTRYDDRMSLLMSLYEGHRAILFMEGDNNNNNNNNVVVNGDVKNSSNNIINTSAVVNDGNGDNKGSNDDDNDGNNKNNNNSNSNNSNSNNSDGHNDNKRNIITINDNESVDDIIKKTEQLLSYAMKLIEERKILKSIEVLSKALEYSTIWNPNGKNVNDDKKLRLICGRSIADIGSVLHIMGRSFQSLMILEEAIMIFEEVHEDKLEKVVKKNASIVSRSLGWNVQ